MSVGSKIQAAASQNHTLLSILSETDYAPPALEQHKRYITDLQTETQKLDTHIKSLEAARIKEHKEHEKYRDSTMKRLAYKMSRKTEKFEARASKEEREYFDALQDEHRAKENKKDLQARLADAVSTRGELESVAQRHVRAQADLDALYDSIFEGPTPEFPAEDERERAAENALAAYHDLRTRTEAEEQAVRILGDAKRKMKQARYALDQALGCSRMDMFGGGSMTDMMERNALSEAEVLISQTQTLVAQAQRMSANVRDLPPVNVAKGNLMSDVFFDNIFTDMAFHDKIKQSMVEFERAAQALDQQVEAAGQRHVGMSQELQQVGRTLEDSRVALQKAREHAFEQVVGR